MTTIKLDNIIHKFLDKIYIMIVYILVLNLLRLKAFKNFILNKLRKKSKEYILSKFRSESFRKYGKGSKLANIDTKRISPILY